MKNQSSAKAKEATTNSASETNGNHFHYCSVPRVPEVKISETVSVDRARAIATTANLWANGTVLRYYMFDQGPWSGPHSQQKAVSDAFDTWRELKIGLEFRKVNFPDEAEIRIGFLQGDGSWSYIGRDVLGIGTSSRTMNFGWDLTRGEGFDTALHEIGHTLGLNHEHQNPIAGIVWDEEAVYKSLGGPPNNWDRETTYNNIIRKLDPRTVKGSVWDPDSVMHYPIEPGMIKSPSEFYETGIRPKGGLSKLDKDWVKKFYPPISSAKYPLLISAKSEELELANGEQANFSIKPSATRYYTIQTFGTCDTTAVLFEDVNGDVQYRTADDDSGEDRNAKIKVKLVKGREYILRVRMVFNDFSTPSSVMMW